MKKLYTLLMSPFGASLSPKTSDFSVFFDKSSRDKKKIISQVLKEANAEQRKVVNEYRKQLTGV